MSYRGSWMFLPKHPQGLRPVYLSGSGGYSAYFHRFGDDHVILESPSGDVRREEMYYGMQFMDVGDQRENPYTLRYRLRACWSLTTWRVKRACRVVWYHVTLLGSPK